MYILLIIVGGIEKIFSVGFLSFLRYPISIILTLFGILLWLGYINIVRMVLNQEQTEYMNLFDFVNQNGLKGCFVIALTNAFVSATLKTLPTFLPIFCAILHALLLSFFSSYCQYGIQYRKPDRHYIHNNATNSRSKN
jgi:hypothetical protein